MLSKYLTAEQPINLLHLNYNIDKEKYRNIYHEIKNTGNWSEKEWIGERWWKVYGIESLVSDVAKDLNIDGIDNYPRFVELVPNNGLPKHIDEDYMSSIIINLSEKTPSIMIENNSVPYECLLFHNGYLMHWVEPVNYERIMLKFCIRHPWEEVYERVKHLC